MNKMCQDAPLIAEVMVDTDEIVANVNGVRNIRDISILAWDVWLWKYWRIQIKHAILIEQGRRDHLRVLTANNVALLIKKSWAIPAVPRDKSQWGESGAVIGCRGRNVRHHNEATRIESG